MVEVRLEDRGEKRMDLKRWEVGEAVGGIAPNDGEKNGNGQHGPVEVCGGDEEAPSCIHQKGADGRGAERL